jgi:hypothetical protein
MTEAEDFPHGDTFLACVERWALRFYDPQSVVFQDERSQGGLDSLEIAHAQLNAAPAVVDYDPRSDNPLKKRYQVFVSSTYEDLVDERKHVMQALLATKCIPSGMELFPAANAEQWEVIKSVIDDCDYYVVIVAGKYGSIGKNGKSYTEMEFDYAVKMQKSILGFYFSDLSSLPAKKIELSDQKRTQLQQFTQKVKSRMCQGWTSPEGLASALKTAILHAMETDPKSGWVRSSELPSWQMVNSLQERITELEGTPHKKRPDEKVLNGKELFQFTATVTWRESDVTSATDRKWELFSADFSLKMTWDALFICFPLKAGKTSTEGGLKKRFQNELAKICQEKIQRRIENSKLDSVKTKVGMSVFENIFQNFVGRGYFVSTIKNSATYYNPSGRKITLWKLTQSGIRKFAFCKTERLIAKTIGITSTV